MSELNDGSNRTTGKEQPRSGLLSSSRDFFRHTLSGFHPSYSGIWARTLWGFYIVRQTGVDYGGVDIHGWFWGIEGLASFVIALLFLSQRNMKSPACDRMLDIFATLLLTLGTILLSIPFPVSGAMTAILGTGVSAIGAAWMLARWVFVYAHMPVRQTVAIILLAYIIVFSEWVLES